MKKTYLLVILLPAAIIMFAGCSKNLDFDQFLDYDEPYSVTRITEVETNQLFEIYIENDVITRSYVISGNGIGILDMNVFETYTVTINHSGTIRPLSWEVDNTDFVLTTHSNLLETNVRANNYGEANLIFRYKLVNSEVKFSLDIKLRTKEIPFINFTSRPFQDNGVILKNNDRFAANTQLAFIVMKPEYVKNKWANQELTITEITTNNSIKVVSGAGAFQPLKLVTFPRNGRYRLVATVQDSVNGLLTSETIEIIIQ